MGDETKETPKPEHTPPKGSSRELAMTLGGVEHRYQATADWTLLRKNDKPLAEMFTVHYRLLGAVSKRPITFVFNGGPGAASAYLHVGALGPKRVVFEADGSLPKPPARLADNLESWLEFTDLVFIDPIGTGFSRVIEEPEPKDGAKEGAKEGDKDPMAPGGDRPKKRPDGGKPFNFDDSKDAPPANPNGDGKPSGR